MFLKPPPIQWVPSIGQLAINTSDRATTQPAEEAFEAPALDRNTV
jgi:hypothetical protein